MDTSKEYIKMCEKAKEIQKEFIKLEVGDYFVNKGGYVHIFCSICYETFSPVDMETVTKLPRQDQLQEILDSTTYKLISNFLNVIGIAVDMSKSKKMTLGELVNQYSMEQLWLAFVMYEKFNKVWDGKEWIKKD